MIRFLAIAFVCLISGAGSALAAITHTQGGCNAENGVSSSNTVACTLGSGVGSGGAFVTGFVARHTGVTGITQIIDENSDACTLVGSDVTGTTVIVRAFICYNLTATSKTFTATLSSSATLATIVVVGEFAGVISSASPLDKTAGQAQTTPGTGSNAITSGAAGTAAVPGELIVAATINGTGAAGAGTITGGTGFTAGATEQTVTNLLRGEYLIQTSSAATTGTFTAGSALDSFATIVLGVMPGEQSSKIVGFAVLNTAAEESSKIVGFAVLQGAIEASSKIVGFAVLCTPPNTVACPGSPPGHASSKGVPF